MNKDIEKRKTVTELLGYIPVATAFEIVIWIDQEIEMEKRKEAIAILDGIKYYERESRSPIGFDERTSEELYDLYLQSKTPNT